MRDVKKEEGMPEVAYYNLKGTTWKQEQNTYKENCLALEFLDRMQSETKIDSIALGVNQFLASPVLPELFAIVLKPHTPTPWAKLKQKFFAWKNKVDLNAPINAMQQWQMRKVLQDFFTLNLASMWNSPTLELVSNLISVNLKNQKSEQGGKSPSTMPSMGDLKVKTN